MNYYIACQIKSGERHYMKISAVIVTHNRLPLLQECISSVRQQSHPVTQIVVINNGSTDGTADWLLQQKDILTFTQANLGGSFGFYRGIKEACALLPDWIWVMDDDSVPTPTALEVLLQAMPKVLSQTVNIGFLSSRVVWTDGADHKCNSVVPLDKEHPHSEENIVPIRSGTFVSILLSKAVVKEVGLPLKDFFIWYDDVEFTRRIVASGYSGFLVKESIVLHETPYNVQNTIYTDNNKSLWKYYYGTRNYLHMRKLQRGKAVYAFYVLKNFLVIPVQILIRRKDHRLAFIKTVWKGTLDSLSFSPKVEYL